MKKKQHFLAGIASAGRSTLRLIIFAVILASTRIVIHAQTAAPIHDDNQIWTEYQLAIPFDNKTDFVAIGVLRFGRNVSRPVNERFGFGVSRKLGSHLTVFPFFLHVASQPTPLVHSSEERITLEATAKFPLGGFTFSDRNRVEFHVPARGPTFTQYRNRHRFDHPLRVGKFEFEGFVADEVFYDSVASDWIRNRFYVGGGKKINPHLFLELYFVRQNDGRAHPGNINALGSTVKVRL